MAGALAILHKKCKETRITIPTSNTVNVFTIMKWLNSLRTGSLQLAGDALHDVKVLLIEIRDMIVTDDDVAARAFKPVGARIELFQVVFERVATPFEQFNFICEHDKLTHGHKGKLIQNHFFDIFGALIDPDAELNNKILIKVATLVFRCAAVVSFS